MDASSQNAGSGKTTAILAVAVLALVGVVAFLLWRPQPVPVQTNPTNPQTAQVTAPAKIELPKTFAAVPKLDKDHAERLDKQLAMLNDLLKERAKEMQGRPETASPVPPDAEQKLKEYQKWLEGDRKPPAPPLPLPPVPSTPSANQTANGSQPATATTDPASDKQWQEVAKQLLMVAGAAICIYQPELCPVVTILAQILEIGDGETIYQTVKVLEGLQNAANGKPFTSEEKEALKKLLTGPLVKLPEGKADSWIGLVETVNSLREPNEKDAARQALRMLDPKQNDPFLSALRVALDKEKITAEDLAPVLAKLPSAGDGKLLITPDKLAMLKDLLTRFGYKAVWEEVKGKLTTGNK